MSHSIILNLKNVTSVVNKNVVQRALHFTKQRNKSQHLITTPELVEKEGYPLEIHRVTTEDGYKLEVHRIPFGKKSKKSENKPVVYLQHGLLCSSFDWTVAGPQKSLSYILADNGYDVWLGNARGNTYSKSHVKLSPNNKEFWNFSWHEIGMYDLPAVIDYALKITKQKNLYYVGHSQGTTSYYVLMSSKPEYNDKVRLMVSFAPVAFMSNLKSPGLRSNVPLIKLLQVYTRRFGYMEYLPNTSLMSRVMRKYSGSKAFDTFLRNYFATLFGFNKSNYDADVIKVLLSNYPAGASVKQVIHYYQGMKSGRFRQFDNGFECNIQKYNRSLPPEYDLQKIKSPIALFYSENDFLSSQHDVDDLYHKLGNCIGKTLIEDQKFNHIDYLYGKNASQILYPKVLELFKKY